MAIFAKRVAPAGGLSLKIGRGQSLIGQARKALPGVATVVIPVSNIQQQAGAVLASIAVGAAFVGTGSYLERELFGRRRR